MIASWFERAVVKKIPWVKGRGIGGYLKYTLFRSSILRCDAHLIYYPQGSSVKPHYDPSPWESHNHHRVNFTLIAPDAGGTFKFVRKYETKVWFEKGRISHFRPDEVRHWVTPVAKGYGLLMSFGWLTKKKGYASV